MLAVHSGGGAQGGLFRLGDLHGLCFVVYIRMGGDFHTVRIEGFKHHDGGSRQGAGVQRIGKLYGSICGFGGELYLGGDFRIIHQQWLIRGLVHEYARNGVGLARGQAGVLHHIHNCDLAGGFGSVLAIHGGSGANAGLLGESDGLSLVLHILVAGNFRLTLEECLKYDNRRSFQPGGIEGEEYVHGAIGFSRGKRGFGRHLFLTNQQGFACGFVHEHAF